MASLPRWPLTPLPCSACVCLQIREIEAEINRTQKNKATNYHIGLLKAKLSKLRSELLEGPKGSKGGGEGFDVMKSGDARVALIGFPSVGQCWTRDTSATTCSPRLTDSVCTVM